MARNPGHETDHVVWRTNIPTPRWFDAALDRGHHRIGRLWGIARYYGLVRERPRTN